MAEAFADRQDRLLERLAGFMDESEGYNGTATIEELQEVLREAEACHELVEKCDDGVLNDAIEERREERRMAGLSIDPAPSAMKCKAWTYLLWARKMLAMAYYEMEEYLSAAPLYHLLVDQALRMRSEIWEQNLTAPYMMNDLSSCYNNAGQYDEARKWLETAIHFCEGEDPSSWMHERLKKNLATMTGSRAGPALDYGTGDKNKKNWKLCWCCGAAPRKDQKFSRCSKCVSLKLATPAYYCSKSCQEQDWTRHKKYHRIVKSEPTESSKLPELPEGFRRFQQEHQESEYVQLLLQSHEAQIEGHQKKARRLLEKCIKMQPKNPSAHYSLAVLFGTCHNVEGEIREYLEVMRIADNWVGPYMCFGAADSPECMWSHAVASIYSTCRRNGAALSFLENKKPDWISDPEKLLKMAKRACRGDPDNSECWLMRAAACEKLGKLDQALQQLSVALEVAKSQESKDWILVETKRVRTVQQRQRQQL